MTSYSRMTSSKMMLFLFSLLVLSTVQAEIRRDPSCSRTACKVPAVKKFKYEEGVVYWYKYSVDVSTNLGTQHVQQQPQNESTLHIDATLVVYFSSPCEGTLKFHNASISHDPTKYNAEFPDRAGAEFRAGLQRFPLRFAFDDGEIHEVCPDNREPVWSLNLKRGILSMLQNSMHRFDIDRRVNELDINGICSTHYRLYEAKRTSLIIQKTKNLADCTHGSKHLSIIQSNFYRSPRSGSHPPQHPLLKSQSECEITIDHNVYEKVVCKDVHRLQPLSSGQTGARTEATAVLELLDESRDAYYQDYEEDNEDENEEQEDEKLGRSIDHLKRTTLLYDYSKTPKTIHGELRTARDLLKTLCRMGANTDELEQRFSETFTSFIHSARLLDYSSLSQMFARAHGICSTGKKHILDALPYLGSNAAITVMNDLIIKGEISTEKISNWVTTFALIPRPNEGTIDALSALLDIENQIPEAQFILSYSAVIHAYCANNNVQCTSMKQISRFLSYLEERIEKGCAPRAHPISSTKTTLEALKAIGNMGLQTETLLEQLKECIDDKGGFLPMEIRVAAIDAHRRLPSCEQTRDQFFLTYYRNFTLDTEIRIASYLQVMRCPDYNVIKTIKHTLKAEEVNQVGTFVWSHLTNLYNSASPTRVEIQSLLTDRDLTSKFNNDIRKFSRNYEGSFFSEEYNFGANYQGNLIFSPRSYIPRTATFNFTMDLFGESVNAFEISTRMEGLEFYAENLFGPNGPYSNEKMTNHFKNFLRMLRAAPEDDDYWQQAKRLPNVIDNNFDHPKVTIGYKVFGNELKYTVLNGDKEIRAALANLNPWLKLKQFTSGKEIQYENTMMFFDSSYVVPMTSGLPVRFDLAGSAACNFKMSGLLDTKRISSGEIDLVTNIMPSASIDMVGSMTVDAFYKTAGIKLRSNVYSSGALQIHLDVKGTRLVRLSLGLPNKKMDVFSISTDVLFTSTNGAEVNERRLGVLMTGHDPKESKHLIIPGNVISNTSCTWSALDRLIGLKLCVDYQLSNVTKDQSAPYFILSGPTLFKMSVIKADPTAKNYVLEYKWEKTKEHSTFRVAFETPGSEVNREVSATAVFDAKSDYVTVVIHSVGNSLVAKGTYKSTENETFIDIGFDVNGVKHLDASIGFTRKKFNYGYTYSPKMYLTINNEKVAALSGSIRNTHKNNMSQCDVYLTFQTKKVWSKLFGYVATRNVSLAADFQLDYQTQSMPRKETLHLEGSLSNRSSRTITHKSADLKLQSTAYPQLNTVITAWYQQAMGHLELHAEVNSSPHLQDDRHKLTAQLIIAYSKLYFQNQDTKVSVLFAITKPIQNVDIKVGINHYAVGAESKTNLLIGYAPGKEITLVVNMFMPRGLLFVMEGHANLTIPNFNSMIINTRINERSRREYELFFAGTWFSGHNITARGTYTDRSVATIVSHSLKMILKSPSFANDVLVNCKLYQNVSDIRINVYVEQLDHDKYAFILNHTVLSATSITTFIEGRYKSNVYSITADIDTQREIRIEMHLDKWRDVHLALIGVNTENKKGFGAEVKWDANRDPALKIAAFFMLERVNMPVVVEGELPERNLTMEVTFTYPGRLITGLCQLTARGEYNYIADLSLDWNPEKVVKLSVLTDYDVKPWTKSMKLETQLVTPFENWKRTALYARYLQDRNEVSISSSAYWKDFQHVMIEFEGSTNHHDNISEWKANCGLTSTVHALSHTTVNITHKLINSQTMDTRLDVNYNPDKVIKAWSIWHLDKQSDNVFNLTGNLHLDSPVTSYKQSDMKCQLQILPNWKFLGTAHLDLDKRKYTANLIGDLYRIKESMVQFNVTTPLEKYHYVRGRFGFSESNRHIVAEVVTPNGPLGFEVLFQLFTPNYDFNIKLLLATPIHVLQKCMLIAKMNRREVDFRVAYNQMTAGFLGAWYYHNITNFHYSYIILTPIQGLEENGIVTKLIITYTEDEKIDIDTEFSVTLASVRIGVKAKGGPKPPPVRLPIDVVLKAAKQIEADDDNDEEDDEEEDEEESFYWRGEIEICPAIIEPIIAELDVDNEGPTYKVYGTLELFNDKIVVDDTFWMEDVFNMKNDLILDTTFKKVDRITSLYVFRIDMERSSYALEMDFNLRANETWTETGIDANYTYYEHESDESRRHVVKFNIKTPLSFLQFVNTRTAIDIDENFYKGTVDILTKDSKVGLFGSLELEENFLDTVIVTEIDSPVLKLPKTRVAIKKDFTDKEKYIKFSADVADPVSKSVFMQSAWKIEKDHAKASIALRTWIDILENLEGDLLYINSISSNNTAIIQTRVKYLTNQEYKLIGNYNAGLVKADLFTPKSPEPYFHYQGETVKISDTMYNVNGELVNVATSKVYKVSTAIVIHDNGQLNTVETIMQPKTEEADSKQILVKLKKELYGLNLAIDAQCLNGTVGMNFINYYNWDVSANIDRLNNSGGNDRYQFSTFMNVQVNGNTSLYVHLETPAKQLETLTLNGNILLTNYTGSLRMNNQLNQDSHYAALQWKLIYAEDIFARLMAGYQIEELGVKDLDTKIFFRNPGKALRNIDTGFDVNIDREKWKFAVNGTLGFRNHENIDGVLFVRFPPPDNDDHRFLVSYHANKGMQDLSYVIGYNAVRAKKNYASDGSLRMATKNIDGHLRFTWGMLPNESVNNLFNVTFDNKDMQLKYSLYSPKFLQQETLVFLFSYDATHDISIRLLNLDLFYPASAQLGTARISYESLINVNGTINATLPSDLTQVGCKFIVFTALQRNKRFIEVFWSNNTALLNTEYVYQSEKLNSNLDGILHLEVPLTTRHIGHITYGYKKRPQVTNGYADMDYNGQKVLQAQYNSKGESRAGFEKDRIQITIENSLKPLGILYINQFEYSEGNHGTNYPTTEYKQVNVYQLNNRTAFDISGEARIRTTHTGQAIHLQAKHANRTVQLRSDHEVLPGEFDQNTWLSLAEDAWMSYHINILNKTTEEMDNQFLILSVAYPTRNFTFNGSYRITSGEFDSEGSLEWDKETIRPRTVGAAFKWMNISSTSMLMQQEAILFLRHPSFEKDVTLKGELMKKDDRDLVNTAFTVDYSTDSRKLFVFTALLRDESDLPSYRKYTYKIKGDHPQTRLDLDVHGFVHKYENVLYETGNNASYKRSFLPVEAGKFNSRLDLNSSFEILFQREYNEIIKYLHVQYYPSDLRYIVNGSAINTPELNATGAFFFAPREKLTWMMVNYTPDAVESLRMYGQIPDARNAVFDVWRTYEDDFRVSDVSFYLKLNHSRLVTSTLRWRPELKSDIINTIKKTVVEMYDNMNSDAEYWRQYIKSETVSTISDVWDDAQDELYEFVDDWSNLKELEQDYERLKIYLNESYNANDFYIQDIVGFGVFVIDELSLHSHIESLPNILNEIWEIMGESGGVIRNSLLWIINAIKNALNKGSEIIGAVLRGDSISQVASIIEGLIEKYDMFIKDLHVSFIKYIENLWNKASQSISQQWNRFLLLVEPLFIRVLHYLETVVWKASKEVVDFLYDRGNDIIASPYFDRFSNFTHDIDKFYRDIQGNDIITNVKKYSGLLIQVLKERYFTFVPFGKELKDVVDEIISELKELQKLPSINYALEKMQQVYDRARYIYDYFEVQAKIEGAIRLIHAKLMDISQTALQAESRYREAKTKFIFDPQPGLMCLEQKLPMSWHAFNQTPEFQEIPEFRAIMDLKAYFETSNITFWSFYYQYKPFTEPSNWLPPFRAQAMIVGAQHYKTFDGRHLDYAGPCTYLLAHDFVRNTFSVFVKYNLEPKITHEIVVLIGENAVVLDLFNDTVKLVSQKSPDESKNLELPAELDKGSTYVYQEENVVTVERAHNQFRLECNLKFDVCTLELSGWYHGKTAGLLGTMNSEIVDDTIASNGIVSDDIGKFAQSWNMETEEKCTTTENFAITDPQSEETISIFCEELFVNRSSEFSSCFGVVEPDDYYDVCLRSTSESEACTITISYMQSCMFHDTYLRIPDMCTTCSMMDGSQLAEGEFKRLEEDDVPRSGDVVFIVEAKECNRDIKQNRSVEQLVTQLNKELIDQGLAGNRWSLVVYGGDGVFGKPRSMILDGQIFTKNVNRFVDYFEHLPIGNGNQDIFEAIGFASGLVFRAGVSKTFILMPCSHCEPENQTLDYSVLHQVLLEHDIRLHILMDDDFVFEKERLNKIFYGLDATRAYTKKDSRTLLGDTDLRRQSKLSKTALGYCAPLSLETNGSIFSSNKLRFDKLASIKKFVAVFSKRIALTAQPNTCQHCECTADNNGVTRMECMPCVYPTAITVDYDTFNLNDSLAVLQPLHMDYGQINIEED